MADIKCPNCGKINPSFADVCLSCQAPLIQDSTTSQGIESSENEIPEWLKRIRERSEQEFGSKPDLEDPVAPFTAGDLPDWLKDLKEEKIDKENHLTAPAPLEESHEDWLEKLRTSPVYDHGDPMQTGPLPDVPGDTQKSHQDLWGPENEGEAPDWLKAATHSNNALNDFVFPKEENTHPDDITSPVPVTESAPNPFASRPEETLPPYQEKEEANFFPLPGGEQSGEPAWMESDQPFTEISGQEELPFIPGVSDPTDSTSGYAPEFFQTMALTNRIQLSEKQRLNVSLLKNIISTEGEPRPISPSAVKRNGRAGLLAVFFTMTLVLSFILAFLPAPIALPQLYPIEIASLFNEVSTLPENSPVLVAVDYDPALAGEMQLSSSALLGHLMSRNARLTFVSTRPTGPMLADTLVQSVLPGQPQYSAADHTVNLGYVPGDAAGLRAFARQPRLTAPYTNYLQPAWDTPALAGMNLLSDFSAVIVITDNAEVMRNWVEQAQPSLGLSPLFVILSAQTGPLIQPYLDSDQVQGGLSGISGGSMYSQILGRSGLSSPYLNAFQAGAIMAAIAIVVGGLINLLAGLFNKPNTGEKT